MEAELHVITCVYIIYYEAKIVLTGPFGYVDCTTIDSRCVTGTRETELKSNAVTKQVYGYDQILAGTTAHRLHNRRSRTGRRRASCNFFLFDHMTACLFRCRSYFKVRLLRLYYRCMSTFDFNQQKIPL